MNIENDTRDNSDLDILHTAICQAVLICNSSVKIVESEDGRKVRNILRQALEDINE